MSDKVFELLASEGKTRIDDLFVRVSARPHFIVASLRDLGKRGFVRVSDPKSVEELEEIIQEARQLNGYDTYSKDEQRRAILAKIDRKFETTFVDLTFKGAKAAHIPFATQP